MYDDVIFRNIQLHRNSYYADKVTFIGGSGPRADMSQDVPESDFWTVEKDDTYRVGGIWRVWNGFVRASFAKSHTKHKQCFTKFVKRPHFFLFILQKIIIKRSGNYRITTVGSSNYDNCWGQSINGVISLVGWIETPLSKISLIFFINLSKDLWWQSFSV